MKNRHSHLVELVILRLKCYLYEFPLQKAPWTGSRSLATFWPKLTWSDVTKSTVTYFFFDGVGKNHRRKLYVKEGMPSFNVLALSFFE